MHSSPGMWLENHFVPWAPSLRDNQYLEGFCPVLYHKQRRLNRETSQTSQGLTKRETVAWDTEWRRRFSTQGPNHLKFEQIPGKITSLLLNDQPGSTPEWPLLLRKLPSHPVRQRLGSSELVHRRSGGRSCNQTQCWAPGYRGTRVPSARGQDTARDWLIIKDFEQKEERITAPLTVISMSPQLRWGKKGEQPTGRGVKGQLQGPLMPLKGGSCPEEPVLGRAGGGARRLLREALLWPVC